MSVSASGAPARLPLSFPTRRSSDLAVHYTETGGHFEAVVREVEDLPPINPDDPAFVALHREARERAAELGQKSGLPERSEEHTSELQSHSDIVCRLLLEKHTVTLSV